MPCWYGKRDLLYSACQIVSFQPIKSRVTKSHNTININATFNNISVASWRSVLLVEETGVPGENHRSVACHWQTLSHNVVSSTPRLERGSISQLLWWSALIAHVVINPTPIQSRPHPIWEQFCSFLCVHAPTNISLGFC